ncbi:DUF362 domain-containing protein [Geomonas sp. RF6]|uniref:DUF362 domain-containing protein n=1 Tax=Geomonas sp. RF6 TaxID=2897342 RepID=UPI001E4E6C87|nr:DUF362 domain-containing protein [Geomonas sp. RF6]UFS72701.1 DUF362 domain-containing protein [Geomonas sp. RF6]
MTSSEEKVGLAVHSSEEGNLYDVERLRTLISDCLCAWGATDAQSPFSDIVSPGMSVLLKPNWVHDQNVSGLGNDCLVTHPNLILAALQEVLKAKPSRVIIADAPIQQCDFSALVPSDLRLRIKDLADLTGCPVEVIDLRRTILRKGGYVAGQDLEVRGDDRYILFDLGKESLLDPVSTPDSRFRITCYHPDLLSLHHRPGKHEYFVAKEPFEADVVINMPKLKAHKKAGLTGAMKNLVGINGNKEFLPHHRLGGSASGGDCYAGWSLIKRMIERCYDEANRGIGTPQCAKWLKRSGQLQRVQNLIGNPEIEGGWHGNDTVWRMTLDLNRLLLYGRSDGTLSDTPLRKVYSLTDALIAGEGEGPLAPSPLVLGVLTFSDSSVFSDLVGASLMHFDYRKIPTVREAFGAFRYPLVTHAPEDCRVLFEGEEITLHDVARWFGKDFHPSAGWRGHIEMTGDAE